MGKITKIKQKAKWAAGNPRQVVSIAKVHSKTASEHGVTGYVRMLKTKRSHQFGCGIKTAYSQFEINKSKYHKKHPFIVVLVGNVINKGHIEALLSLQQNQHCHFFAAKDVANELINHSGDKKIVTVVSGLNAAKNVNIPTLRSTLMQTHMDNDVVLLDLAEEVPKSNFFSTIQHVAYNYHNEIGMVAPAYLHKDKQYSGVEFDRIQKDFHWIGEAQNEVGQLQIPRYTLNSYWHGVYIRFKALQYLSFSSFDIPSGIEEGVSYVVAQAWQQNIRTLTYAPLSIEIKKMPKLAMREYHKKWLLDRNVKNKDGKTRVIYVLNATSVSGGIKTVFEHINGLLERDFEVELWSLQGQPDWMDLNVKVKKFYNYQDIEVALRNEDAIKIATWWETSQPVWIASVNHGIGVNFIQEFESWFYPDDPVARAAVISTYRKELISMTTSSYNKDELGAVGMKNIPLIPVGYDGDTYHQEKNTIRKQDAMLAVGRSFFQKNFEFTKQAWLSLGENRPRLELFGGEPDILVDKKAYYHVKPSNEEVNSLYNSATFLVQTSRHEGFCLPIIEAMAAGCPVICTDAHGNRDFSIDEETCLMVEHDNIPQLVGAIEKLRNDRKLQARLRKNGLAMAKKYEWTAIIDQVAKFYKNLN